MIPLGFGHKSQCVLVGERKRELPYWKLSSVIPLGFGHMSQCVLAGERKREDNKRELHKKREFQFLKPPH